MRGLGVLLSCALGACAGKSSFVLTGTERVALAEETPIQPYLTGLPKGPYDEIGVVEVRGFTLEDRVERAARVARQHGGNAIILLSSSVHVQANPAVGGGAVFVPGPYYYGAWAMRAPSSSVNSYEVDRYVVAWVEDAD